MSKLNAGVFADHTNRKLIGRVLRENFHLYVGRYALAFLLMLCVAGAQGAAALLMQVVTEVIFRAPPEVSAAANPPGSAIEQWLSDAGAWLFSLFASAGPGMQQIFNVAVAIILVFWSKEPASTARM